MDNITELRLQIKQLPKSHSFFIQKILIKQHNQNLQRSKVANITNKIGHFNFNTSYETFT